MPTLSRHASGTVSVTPEVVFQVLTDYDAYSEWMPYIVKSSTMAVEGDLAIAEVEIGERGAVQMECMHSPGRQVVGRPLGGEVTLRKLDWRLSPSGSGTKVDLDIEFALGKSLLKRATWRMLNAAGMLKALTRQCSGFATDSGTSDSVLDLMETPAGLILILNGKRYVCKPEEEKA